MLVGGETKVSHDALIWQLPVCRSGAEVRLICPGAELRTSEAFKLPYTGLTVHYYVIIMQLAYNTIQCCIGNSCWVPRHKRFRVSRYLLGGLLGMVAGSIGRSIRAAQAVGPRYCSTRFSSLFPLYREPIHPDQVMFPATTDEVTDAVAADVPDQVAAQVPDDIFDEISDEGAVQAADGVTDATGAADESVHETTNEADKVVDRATDLIIPTTEQPLGTYKNQPIGDEDEDDDGSGDDDVLYLGSRPASTTSPGSPCAPKPAIDNEVTLGEDDDILSQLQGRSMKGTRQDWAKTCAFYCQRQNNVRKILYISLKAEVLPKLVSIDC